MVEQTKKAPEVIGLPTSSEPAVKSLKFNYFICNWVLGYMLGADIIKFLHDTYELSEYGSRMIIKENQLDPHEKKEKEIVKNHQFYVDRSA